MITGLVSGDFLSTGISAGEIFLKVTFFAFALSAIFSSFSQETAIEKTSDTLSFFLASTETFETETEVVSDCFILSTERAFSKAFSFGSPGAVLISETIIGIFLLLITKNQKGPFC